MTVVIVYWAACVLPLQLVPMQVWDCQMCSCVRNLTVDCCVVPTIFVHSVVFREGFRKRGALGFLFFGVPSWHDLFGRLSEKRESMPFVCVVPPQKSIFCCADYGSTIAVDLQQTLKPFLHSSKKQRHCDLFLEFIALSCSSEVLFGKFPWFLAFSVGLFFGYIHFIAGLCCLPRKYRLALDLITCT